MVWSVGRWGLGRGPRPRHYLTKWHNSVKGGKTIKLNYNKKDIFNYDYIKFLKYNNDNYKLIQFKHPVRKPGFEEDSKFKIDNEDIEETEKTENQEEEYLRQSISRTKKNIHDYALCNDFQYFVTLTFDRKKYDSTDIRLLKLQVGQWLNNYKKRTNSNLKYLLIPELHSDKEHFHFHGLISGIEDITEFRESSKGIMRYNWKSWHDKFGFTSLEQIRSLESVSKYITKYITKDLVIEFNKQRYLVSKGLKKPETFFALNNYTKEIPCNFENEYVRILNISSYDMLVETLFMISDNRKEDTYAIDTSYWRF